MRTVQITMIMILGSFNMLCNVLPMDVIVLKNNKQQSDTTGRIDLFSGIPYQILRFREENSNYNAKFTAVVRILNSSRKKVIEDVFDNLATTNSYFNAQGGGGGFHPIYRNYPLLPGEYIVELNIQDEGGKNIAFAEKKIIVADYAMFEHALSGIMLVSHIEEINGRMKVTPHLTDNIYDLKNGFFAFFQIYSSAPRRVNIDWVIEDQSGNVVLSGDTGVEEIGVGVFQRKIYLSDIDTLPIDNLIMKVFLRETDTGNSVIAAADRSLDNLPSSGAEILNDIDQAISMLAYVSGSETIDSLENLSNERLKRKGFLEFWDSKDPSPNTRKNEAFEEYFARIHYANQQFGTYASGWLTDMGRIYIVLGPPDNVSQNQGMNTQIMQQIWIYNNIGRFVFQDRSGMGDYRLVQPIGFRNKYEYGRRQGR